MDQYGRDVARVSCHVTSDLFYSVWQEQCRTRPSRARRIQKLAAFFHTRRVPALGADRGESRRADLTVICRRRPLVGTDPRTSRRVVRTSASKATYGSRDTYRAS